MGPKLVRPAFYGDSHALPQPVRACSACAGDYEDPDRTAWPPDLEEDDGDEGLPLESQRTDTNNAPGDVDRNDDEFPARET
jgi:hypothetical protein